MVREPKIRDAAQILRDQLAELGFTLPNQKSLDIAAKMKGYSGFQMYNQQHPNEKRAKSAAPVYFVELDKQLAASEEEVFGVAKVALQLANVFGLHEEWSQHTREDWRHEVENQYTNLGYWDWCVHQAESSDITNLYLEEVYLVNLWDVTAHRSPRETGWVWVTDKNDIVFDGSKPLLHIYDGPYVTHEEALESMAQTHPLTRRLFAGNPANLPPVGPGNVLDDLLKSHPQTMEVTKVFRGSSSELARKLAGRFVSEGQWARFPAAIWSKQDPDAVSGYWDWCVKQALNDAEADLNISEVFYLKLQSSGEKNGWWWSTSPDWRFIARLQRTVGGVEPNPSVKFGGPFSTERGLKESLTLCMPFAEQRFLGTVHSMAGDNFLTS